MEATEKWVWMCPGCIDGEPASLQGRRICIWWPGDQVYYPGTIHDFDAASRSHRIIYDDEDWEFVKLPIEIVLYAEQLEVEEPTVDSKKRKATADTSLEEVVEKKIPRKVRHNL